MKLIPLCLSLVLAVATGGVLAQSYECGGVSIDDQQRIKAAAPGRDLMLTFAISTGAYLADVGVQIRDSRGAVVLDVTCDGPIMLADVPARGIYRVTARFGGVVRERSVNVTRGKRPASATLVWPAGPD